MRFLNKNLLSATRSALRSRGLEVLIHIAVKISISSQSGRGFLSARYRLRGAAELRLLAGARSAFAFLHRLAMIALRISQFFAANILQFLHPRSCNFTSTDLSLSVSYILQQSFY